MALGGSGGFEVVGGAVDAVCVVVDVCFTVAVSVDAVGGEGGGHELHESFGAGAAGGVLASVVGFCHADTSQERPRELMFGGCLFVEDQNAVWDGGRWVSEAGSAWFPGWGQRLGWVHIEAGVGGGDGCCCGGDGYDGESDGERCRSEEGDGGEGEPGGGFHGYRAGSRASLV